MNSTPQPASPAWSGPKTFFLACALLLSFGLQVHPLADPDIYMHMRDGRYWVETGFQFGAEPFVYTVADKPMDKIEVLFSVGLYGLWHLGGFRALILAKALIMTAVFFLLGLILYRRWPNLAVAAGAAMGIQLLPTLLFFFRERPYLFTYLFLVLAMFLLERFRQAPRAPLGRSLLRLWWLPAITLVWANLHPGFIVLFVLLGAHVAEEAVTLVRSDRDDGARVCFQALGLAAAAAFLAGALNPLGFGVYTYVFQHVGSEAFAAFISEWNPPTFAKHGDFFVLLTLVWLGQLAGWRRWRVSDLLPLAVFSYLAVQSYRHIPLFILAALPPTVSQARNWLQAVTRRQPWPALPAWSWLAGGALALLLLTGTAALGRAGHLSELPDYYPVAGVAWIQQEPSSGRWFTPMAWSGYLGWETHGQKQVFIDGRLMMFGGKVFEDYIQISTGEPKLCQALLDQYDVQGILSYTDDPTGHENHLKLFSRLEESGQWALVYWDHICHIYVRRGGPNQALIDRFEYRAVTPWKPLPYCFTLSDMDATLKEIRHAQETTPASYLPWFFEGQIALNRNQNEEAVRAFQLALKLEPGLYTAYYNLGMIALRTGDSAGAEAMLRKSLSLNPKPEHRKEILKLLDRAQGKWD
ncbi:MAG: tetratricopeptide repeat protein [candidate division FCPU426 bacterium]